MNLNRVELIGHVAADPTPRKLPSGVLLTNLTLAMGLSSKDRERSVAYYPVVMFGRLAEVAAKYLKKSDRVYVEGKLSMRAWKGKDGKEHSRMEIVAQNLIMLGQPHRSKTTETEQPEETTNDDVVVEEIEVNGEG